MRYPLQLIVIALALIAVSSCSHAGPRQIDVIVAARDLKTGTIIVETDIDTVRIDPSMAPKTVPRFRHEVIGHKVMHPVTKEEFILPSKLSAEADVQ